MQLSKAFYIFTASVILMGAFSLVQLDWEASGGNPVLLERFRELRRSFVSADNPVLQNDAAPEYSRPIIPPPIESIAILPDDIIAVTGEKRPPANRDIPTPPGYEASREGHGHQADDIQTPEDVDLDLDEGDEPGDIDPDEDTRDELGDAPGDFVPDPVPDPDPDTESNPVKNDNNTNENVKTSSDNSFKSSSEATQGNNQPANDVD